MHYAALEFMNLHSRMKDVHEAIRSHLVIAERGWDNNHGVVGQLEDVFDVG